jgi:sulfate/thiosulfate transport system permease protein
MKRRFKFSSIPIAAPVTAIYLSLMLLLPVAALLTTAFSTNPGEFWRIATSPTALSAYSVTFGIAVVTAVINGLFGTLIAWVLVRYTFPFRRLVDAVVDLPFALPTAVAGLTLATVYSKTGWVGAMVAPFGIKLAFNQVGVAIAMLFTSLPFVVRTVQPVLAEMDRDMEEAAWSLGATPWETFWKVTLPPLFPAILTGVALGFARAVGEYGSTVMISSNTPFKDLIAPVLIFQRLEQYDLFGATVIGAVMLLISLLMLFAINLLQAWGRRYAQ